MAPSKQAKNVYKYWCILSYFHNEATYIYCKLIKHLFRFMKVCDRLI